jgi:hypothetical protein
VDTGRGEPGGVLSLSTRPIGDPKNQTRTLFAVCRVGHVKYVEKFAYGDEVFVPARLDDPLLRSIALPRGVQPREAPTAMTGSIGALLNEVEELSAPHQLVLGTL